MLKVVTIDDGHGDEEYISEFLPGPAISRAAQGGSWVLDSHQSYSPY